MYKKQSSPLAIETQEKIRGSLLKELASKPLIQVKVSDLCKDAGVSRNAFYRNFDTVEDVLMYHLDTLCPEMVEQLSVLTRGKDYMERYIATFFRFWYGHRDVLDLFFRNNLSNLLVGRLSEMIEFTWDMGTNVTAAETPIKGYVFMSAGLTGVLYTWIRNGYNISPDMLAKWMVQNLRSGLDLE